MAKQQCSQCGSTVQVVPDGRGFPPDIAKNKLKKICKAHGCVSNPKYTADFIVGPTITGMTNDS